MKAKQFIDAITSKVTTMDREEGWEISDELTALRGCLIEAMTHVRKAAEVTSESHYRIVSTRFYELIEVEDLICAMLGRAVGFDNAIQKICRKHENEVTK